ncbi:glutaredoxin family protein [Diaphorobacter sp. HDW4A]|uniref:glutaredoxin domain-containing protein n=1 Tax=Diaphorobacter sp. HDW4A TaxID=2714924 RepID=UPI00140AEC19|nr:glutaredoxin domain-containing protein [Diaphorobacter sp. HDW4A]QIL80218.1 glutaredoxin family protein [Diaphorobacter sp. HDW4A]
MSRVGKLSVFAAATLLCATAVVSVGVQAQQIYRSVGPDGKVTFSDQPPANNANASVKSKGSAATDFAESDTGNGALPYTLQQVVNRYPVTLYTGDDCLPCNNARNLLITRGIPFTERTVTNNESMEALKALSGNNSIPFATIGAQHLNGFADTLWTQYLDAAGYPKKSQLPASYRKPLATPLATAKEPARAPAPTQDARPAARSAPAPETTVPSGPTPSNPTGLVF